MANPATVQTSAKTFTARGMWLPIGRVNFYRHDEDHYLHRSILEHGCELLPYSRVDPSASNPSQQATIERSESLQSSVFQRLAIVLPDKGYTKCIPIIPSYRLPYTNESDPESAIFLSFHADLKRALEATKGHEQEHRLLPRKAEVGTPDWQDILSDTVDLLALFVKADGYYLWFAFLKSEIVLDRALELSLQRALGIYIYWIVGGSYFSHFSGEDGSQTSDQQSPPDPERAQSLQKYRDGHWGILDFFQLNTLLEGMYNYNFDPLVFFTESGVQVDRGQGGEARDVKDIVDARKQKYAIGGIIESVSAQVRYADRNAESSTPSATPPSVTSPSTDSPQGELANLTAQIVLHGLLDRSRDLFPEPASESEEHPVSSIAKLKEQLLHQLEEGNVEGNSILRHEGEPLVLSDDLHIAAEDLSRAALIGDARRDMLRQFLRVTASDSLREMKARIERCRRALLTEMIEITHRSEPVTQVEIPPADSVERRSAAPLAPFASANEAQLRGYIMLLAAKLPMIENVSQYLEDSLLRLKATPRHSINSWSHGWMALLQGIRNDITGLEHAIEQARLDRLLTEEERIRSEQETLAEIQHIEQTESGEGTSERALSLSLLANIFAFFAIIVAIYNASQNQQGLLVKNIFDQINSAIDTYITRAQPAHAIAEAILGAVVFSLLYAILDLIAFQVIRFIARGVQLISGSARNGDGANYYEMDIQLEVPMNGADAQRLLDTKSRFSVVGGQWLDVTKQLPWSKSSHLDEDRRQLIDENDQRLRGLVKRRLESIRIPVRRSYRVERTGTDEALHKIYISTVIRWKRPWPLLGLEKMNLIVIYEVLYHYPSSAHSYALKDVRVVTTDMSTLDSQQLMELKLLIATRFINEFLAEAKRRITLPPAGVSLDRFDALFTVNKLGLSRSALARSTPER